MLPAGRLPRRLFSQPLLRTVTTALAGTQLARAGLGRVVLGTVAVGGSGAAAYVSNDEGIKRSATFWLNVMPVYVHYRAVEWWVKDQSVDQQAAAYNTLHDKYTQHMETLALRLRGFYMKVCQLASTQDHFVPDQYMRWCKQLQDSVPASMGPAEVRAVVERSLGQPIAAVFRTFDDTPLGAASIGQVHRATLHDGREVVVKVQYPGIEKIFRADIKTAKEFCAMAQPAHLSFMEEVEKQFLTEFDYRREAENLERVRKNIMPVWGHRVCIPRAVTELCTHDVLVMEYLPGVRLVDGLRAQFRALAEAQGKTLEQLEAEQRAKMEAGAGSSQSLRSAHLRMRALSLYLWVQVLCANTMLALYNWTLGWAQPRPYRTYVQPIDLAETLQLLLQVHGHQILIDGSFNGDPHPGNILLMPDGRLGLLDYGQVKNIGPDTRRTYARLIKAIHEDDRAEIVRITLEDMGLRTDHSDPDVIYRLTCFFHDRDTPEITGGLNPQLFMEEMERRDPIRNQPEDYIMAGRVSVLLRGMANAFGLRLHVTEHWLPYALRALEEPALGA